MVAPSITLNREDLYDWVWRMPMKDIAKELGIEPPHVGKICKRRRVPTPPVGYWMKSESRRREVRPPALPTIKQGGLRSVLVRRLDGQTWTDEELRECEAMYKARRDARREAVENKGLAAAQRALLIDMSHRSDEAEGLRRLLGRIKALAEPSGHQSARKWQTWIEGQIERLDPLTGGLADLISALENAGLSQA